MNWPIALLGELCTKIGSGATPRGGNKSYKKTGIALVRSMNVRLGQFKMDKIAFIDEDQAAKLSNVIVEPDDVLLNITGASVARCCALDNSVLPARVNQHVCILRPDQNKLNYRYLMHFLCSGQMQKNLLRIAGAGATREAITKSEVERLEIPLPPLSEQKRIAAILDKADNLRRKRQEAIELADELLRSVFLDMFGDPVTNPKRWVCRTIGECIKDGAVLNIQDGNHGNDHPKVADFTASGYPFVTANVVRDGKILFDQCYYLDETWLEKLRIGFAKPGDLLISHKGTLGLTAILDDTFPIYILSPQTTYYRLSHQHIDSTYLKGYFDTKYFQNIFRKEGIQSTRAYLGITRQKDLPIMIPSLKKQIEYSEVVSKMASFSCVSALGDQDIGKLFGSLSVNAFGGHI